MISLSKPLDQRWAQARRVLLVRMDNLGDVLMSTPAMAAVRQGLPHARLTLLASPSGAAIQPHLPMLDDAIMYRAPWVLGGPQDEGVEQDRQMVEHLRAQAFDAAIIFTVATQSALPAALLCRQAGIALCLGHSRENPYRLMSHWVKDTDAIRHGMRHEVQRQLDLVASVGFDGTARPLSFALHPRDAAQARHKLGQAMRGSPGPYALIHPGATAASRRYDPKAFGEAAALLAAAGLSVVFAGGPGEAAHIDAALASMRQRGTSPAAVLCGNLSLGELAALIKEAKVLVANNSAPAHLAAALGTPVVDLYALTNPQHTPWMARSTVLSHDVPCRDCLRSVCPEGHHDCLRQVAPATVAQAALQWVHVARPASVGSSQTHAARRHHVAQEAPTP